MAWRVVTAPTAEPLKLHEVRRFLRLDDNSEDTLLLELIAAARQHVEIGCNRALMPQQWAISYPRFPASALQGLRLPGGLVRSIDSITYYDADGGQQTLDGANYRLGDAEPYRVYTTGEWPDTDADRAEAVTVTYQVGYADAASVPWAIKHAMRFLVAHWFEHRTPVVVGETTSALPQSVDALLFPYRDGATL